jgi:adenosylcobinamide-phosphate synthase
MSFFAILFALLLEQVRPLARAQPHPRFAARLGALGQPQFRRRQAAARLGRVGLAVSGRRWRRWPSTGRCCCSSAGRRPWCGAWPCCTSRWASASSATTSPAIRDALEAGDETGRAAAGAMAAGRRQRAAAQRDRPPRHRVLGAGRAPPRVRRAGLVLGAGGLRLRAGRRGAVPHERVRHALLALPQPHRRCSRPARRCNRRRPSAWAVIDWLPARITAIAFAMVGSFEEAIDCWRNHAQRFPNDNDGVILAATSGAVNVRLGGEALRAGVRAQQLARPSAPRRRARAEPPTGHRKHARPRSRDPPTCAASSAWCGGRWCCGWCCWRC